MKLTNPFPHEIVYMDPPWHRTPFGTAKTPYKTMSWESIRAFDLGVWLAPQAVVFVWTTGPTHLKECAVLSHWCERFGASGPRPRLVKPLGEDVIALTTQPKRVFPLLTESQVQWVFAPKPAPGSHSRKPAEVRTRIVELLGPRLRVELFARESIEGWNAWGDECPADEINNP